MKTFLLALAALAVAPAPPQTSAPQPQAEAAAQAAPASPAPAATVDADPALWVVKDADTTIYLFGTVHVLKPGLSWFDEAVKAAFDKSDALALELVMPDPMAMQGLVMKLAVNPTGPSLTEKLPPDTRAAFTKAMTEAGLPATALDRLDPWYAATALSLMPIMKEGYQAENAPEAVLTAAAKAAGKPVIGLETAEQQLGYLDGLSEPAQIAFLTGTLDDLPKAGEEFAAMLKDWSAGDPEALGELMNDSLRDSPEVAKTLLTNRNMRWADWIEARMKQPGSVFVAVGAGHLAGPDSVQAQLAKHHLTATRIAY